MDAGDRLLAGRYQLDRPLGAGALGQVFEAADRATGGLVAVKVAHAQLVGDAGARAGFLRAAREAARLAHPNVVAVLGVGEDQGVAFVAMELVEGRSLRELLRSVGPAPMERAVEISAQVCSALGAAHAQGLIHGGLTPGNVMTWPDGHVQVADFGLATVLGAGTPEAAAYRSPEQIQSGRADDRCDLYALGCCLFELLTGEPPFDGPTPFVVMRRHVEEHPRPPSAVRPGVPDWLDELVLRALAKHPHERPQTAAELRHALAQFPQATAWPVATRQPTPPAAPVPEAVRAAEPPDGDHAPAEAVHDAGTPAEPEAVTGEADQAEGMPVAADDPGQALADEAGAAAGHALPPHEERVRALTRFPEPPKRNRRLALATIAVGLAIVVVASIGLVAPGLVFDIGPGTASDATVTTASTAATAAPAAPATPRQVPALTGVARAEAARLLQAAGAVVGKVRLVREPRAAEGQVLETSPPAGTTLRDGQAVDLVVSNGGDPVTVTELIAVIDAGPSRVGPRGRTFRGRLAKLASLSGERRRLEIADLLGIARAGAGNGDFTPEFSRMAVEVLSRTS